MKKLTFFKRLEVGLILFAVLLRYMEKRGYIFYFCRYIPYPNILYWLLLIIILLALFYILPKSNAKIRYYVLVAFFAPCSFIYVWFSFRFAEGPVVTIKNSPDKVHQIFFVEYLPEHLETKIYERINILILKEIAEPSFYYKGSYPVYNEQFSLDWCSTGFIMSPKPQPDGYYLEMVTVQYATTKD